MDEKTQGRAADTGSSDDRDRAERITFKAFGVAFAKFWGYPLRLESSREEAMAIAADLLAERKQLRQPDGGSSGQCENNL